MLALVSLPQSSFACTGSSLAGSITPSNDWQTLGGIQAGERYTFTIGVGEVIIFSFCQGGSSYTNDPAIDIHDVGGTVSYQYNDDHCGLGSENVWLCIATGTYSVGFYDFYCQSNNDALGTVAYKLLPTPTEQDCLGALPLCESFTSHPESYSGTGHYYDIFNFSDQQGMPVTTNNCPNCLVTGERHCVWYTFTAQTSGNLAFTIAPVVSSDDYDWALYSLNGGVDCFDLVDFTGHPPVSCNYSYGGNGNTGIGSGSSSCVGPVSDQLFNSTFAVTPGETYVLNVSNFSSTQNGYSINFGMSTAQILDNSAPVMDALVYTPYCGSSSVTVQFSESIWCQSAQASDFTLTGPNGDYTIDDAWSVICASASANTYAGTWYDDVWTLELGDYLSQSGQYTLTLADGGVDDKCGNVNVENQLVFDVNGITADLNTVSLCGCNGQSNGELSLTNIGGGTAPYSIDWEGPSSFTSTLDVITNLEPGMYRATITDSEGICEWVDSVDLTGAPAINPTATNNGPVCQGEDLELYGGSDDAASTFAWSGPGAFSSTSEDPILTNSTVGMTGMYSLVVTDSYGCTASATTDAVVYLVTPVSVTTNTPYCEGEDIILNATTVVGAGYAWTGPGAYTAAVEDPTIAGCVITDGGPYVVVVTDVNMCTATASTTVVVNPGIVATVSGVDPLCYQLPTGQITINETAGTPPYTYAWPDGSILNPATNLLGDVSICVSITDNVGCTLEVCHTLVDPAELVVTTASVPTQCGFLEGEITATVTGGTGAHTTTWTESYSGDYIIGLHPGDYDGIIVDANGCTVLVTETVGFFGAGVVSITQIQDIMCFGNTTAVLTSEMTDGTLPYTYIWTEPGQTSANLSGIGAGTYSVSIVDTYGCSGEISYDVTQPDLLTMNFAHVDILCRGGNNGSATVSVVGGVNPYTYDWEHGPTSSHISGLIAGTYSVVVNDLNGCTLSDYVEVLQPEKNLNMNLTASDVTCEGRFDGGAIAQGDGGTSPYTIYWFQYDQLIASGEELTSLRAGDYTVELFDANNCTTDGSFSIIEPAALNVNSELTAVTCKGYSDGTITVSPNGGTAPYEITWSNGDSTTNGYNLVSGTYFITVTDGKQCSKSIGLVVPDSDRLCLGIPDAFTPNSDGINDTWEIQYIEMYQSSYVNVFNRWGQHVYQGVPNGDFWDGKFNGNFVPAGAYQYVIDLRNGMEPFTGVVVVVY